VDAVAANGNGRAARGSALRRVLAGSIVGTALEWYDFFIYGTAAALGLQPLYGRLSDRIGRRPLNLWSVCFTALYAFPFWLLLDTGSPVAIFLASASGNPSRMRS
jgi:MFS family permease